MRQLAPALACLLACGGHVAVPPPPVVPVASLPPPTPPVPTLRLPAGPRPTGYVLDLTLDPGVKTFQGAVDIGLELPPATAFLWLNAKHLTVTEAHLTAGTQQIQVTAHPDGGQFLGFTFARAASGPATLHVAYTGEVGVRGQGLHVEQSGPDHYLLTQLEDIDARAVVPCFDEPSYKVPWRLTVHVPKGLLAVSNTHVVEEADEADGRHRVAFAATRPLPSYLLAVAVGPFEAVDAGTAGQNHTPLRVIVPRGRAAEAAFVAGVMPELLRRLEAYFGIPFPYDKLDELAQPAGGGTGAMENAGLIISGESALLANKASDSDELRQLMTEIAAHEMAHQWFGDLVTMAWWDDVWLNEAFATWMEQKVFNVRPEWLPDVERANARWTAMAADVLASAREVRQPIQSIDDIATAFDAITYQKGAAVIGMFEHAIGADKFQKGVHDYLQAHADRNGTTADFLGALSAAAGTDVAPAFSSFLDQPGLPAVMLRVGCAGGKGKVDLAQTRYLPVGSKGQQESWRIPVCIQAADAKKPHVACTSLAGASGSVALDACPAWVHGNAGAAGYYTTVYDGDALAKLVAAAERLDLAEQLALVDDVRLQIVGGTLPADRALDAITRLARGAPPDVLAELADTVDDIQDRGLVPGGEAAPFAAWVQRVFGARAKALGWKPRSGETAAVRRLRPTLLTIVALHGRDRALRDEARTLASRWLEDPKVADAQVVPALLRVAAWSSDEPFLNRLRAAVPKATGQTRSRLIHALYQFNDPELIGRAAQALLTNDAKPLDIYYMKEVALTGSARPGLFRFVRDHFDALASKAGDWSATLLLSGRPICDPESQAAYQQFFADRAPRLLGGARVYASVIERIELCRAARKAQEQPMAAYFRRK